MGKCTVVSAKGILTGSHIDEIIAFCQKKILLKGRGQAFLSESAAFALKDAGIDLVGTDADSISSPDAIDEINNEFSDGNVLMLEGLELDNVPDGDYVLVAFPMKITGKSTAPCRAVLIGDNI